MTDSVKMNDWKKKRESPADFPIKRIASILPPSSMPDDETRVIEDKDVLKTAAKMEVLQKIKSRECPPVPAPLRRFFAGLTAHRWSSLSR